MEDKRTLSADAVKWYQRQVAHVILGGVVLWFLTALRILTGRLMVVLWVAFGIIFGTHWISLQLQSELVYNWVNESDNDEQSSEAESDDEQESGTESDDSCLSAQRQLRKDERAQMLCAVIDQFDDWSFGKRRTSMAMFLADQEMDQPDVWDWVEPDSKMGGHGTWAEPHPRGEQLTEMIEQMIEHDLLTEKRSEHTDRNGRVRASFEYKTTDIGSRVVDNKLDDEAIESIRANVKVVASGTIPTVRSHIHDEYPEYDPSVTIR